MSDDLKPCPFCGAIAGHRGRFHMTRADLLRAAAEARATMKQLAKLFPGCFHADGRPIVAEARLLPPLSTTKEQK